MSTWRPVRLNAGSSLLTLDLPPGWWTINPKEPSADIAAIVATTTAGLPTDSKAAADLTAELTRMARVGAAGGAVLLAGGAAVDPVEPKIITASLTLMPYETYVAIDHGDQERGPDGSFEVAAGPGLRHLWLGPAQLTFGEILMLEVDYVISPPGLASWSLVFRTPALERRGELVEVFDRIVETFRVSHGPAVNVAGAFG